MASYANMQDCPIFGNTFASGWGESKSGQAFQAQMQHQAVSICQVLQQLLLQILRLGLRLGVFGRWAEVQNLQGRGVIMVLFVPGK